MVPNMKKHPCCQHGGIREDGWTDGWTDGRTGPFPGNNNVAKLVQCDKVGELEQWL